MANEAVVTDYFGINGDQVSFTIVDNTAIAKGAILKMTTDRTAIINSGAGDVLCGLAAHAKTASDGKTQMSVITNCIAKFTIVAGGSTTVGKGVRVSATANQIDAITTLDDENGKQLGIALETGAAGETVLVRVHTLA